MSYLSNVQYTKIMLRYKRLSQNAFIPTRASDLSAGYDMYSAYDETIPAKGKVLVKTDLQLELPNGCYGRLAPRSGLALHDFIDVGAGVIDADYRGNVGIILFNFADSDFHVKKGDKIAQLICEKIEYPELEEVKADEEMSATKRGTKGFGSSGLK